MSTALSFPCTVSLQTLFDNSGILPSFVSLHHTSKTAFWILMHFYAKKSGLSYTSNPRHSQNSFLGYLNLSWLFLKYQNDICRRDWTHTNQFRPAPLPPKHASLQQFLEESDRIIPYLQLYECFSNRIQHLVNLNTHLNNLDSAFKVTETWVIPLEDKTGPKFTFKESFELNLPPIQVTETNSLVTRTKKVIGQKTHTIKQIIPGLVSFLSQRQLNPPNHSTSTFWGLGTLLPWFRMVWAVREPWGSMITSIF